MGIMRSGMGQDVLDDRAERERRDEGERADDDDRTDEHAHEERRVRRERAFAHGHDLLLYERSGKRNSRDLYPEAAEEHRETEGGVVKGRIGTEAGEGAAVVVGRRGEGVEHLTEAVRAGIEDGLRTALGDDCDGGADEDDGARD